MTADEYWKAREQESSHAAAAAMKLYGMDIDAEAVKAIANEAAGEYSRLTIMGAVAEFFRAANRVAR